MGLETGGPISQTNIGLAGLGSRSDVVIEKAGWQDVRRGVWEARLNKLDTPQIWE